MKLYIVSAEDNDYDEFDSFVVSANDEDEALRVVLDRHNTSNFQYKAEIDLIAEDSIYREVGIVHESFNAG